jgi:beta-glucanase (GH16 family)
VSSVTTNADVLCRDDVSFLDANNESVYRIVRPDGDIETNLIAQNLLKCVKDALGVGIKNVSDLEDGTDMFEILIGDVNRPEVKTAKAYLFEKSGGRYEDYIICTIGKKIVIYSQSYDSLRIAIEYFAENYLMPQGVKNGIEYIYQSKAEYQNVSVNGVSIGRFSFVRQHYNASYLTELEMNRLVEDLFSRTGYRLAIVHDEYVEPAEYEIVVGNANRDGVEKIADYDEFRIEIKGKKIYLNGGSAHATAMAVAEFKKMLNGDLADKMSVTGTYETALATYDKTKTLYKTYGEDFDGNEIDTSKWKVGDTSMYTPALNGKIQVRSERSDDVFQRDGKYYMCARADEHFYYGGIIQTYATYRYGYIEMSSVIPHGKGFWTALYLCTDDTISYVDPETSLLAGPEYDVMECFGNSEHFAANIHSWPNVGKAMYGWEHNSLDTNYSNEKRYHSPDKGVVLGYDFHTYGMMWDSERVTFTCDADPYFSYDTTTNLQDIETNNHNVWIRIAMNVGSATNPEPGITENPDDWHKTNKFIIDWVNVYQKNDGKCMLNQKLLK